MYTKQETSLRAVVCTLNRKLASEQLFAILQSKWIGPQGLTTLVTALPLQCNTNTYIYVWTKVLHGCCKPVFITLRFYTNLTLPVIEFPFHKELSGEKILEKRPPTMTLTSMGIIINKREFWRYLSGEIYEKSYSKMLMFSDNKAVEQVKICERNTE